MINLLLGAPGGGKSYEAVVYHIIPALAKGRKVITNLALNLDNFPPEQRDLIELRHNTKAEPKKVDWEKAESLFKRFGIAAKTPVYKKVAFANLEDYGDTWRHPDLGFGPLYVIDECHLCLPRLGTPIAVEEWYSLHRHEFADVLLISQSYGKINKSIIDLIQVMYRVRKATAFGFSNHYIRKVFDGLKGDLVNTSERKYQEKYFKYYTSHTRSNGMGKEEGASDIVPIWKRWPFILSPILLVGSCVSFANIGSVNPITVATQKKDSPPAPVVASQVVQVEHPVRARMSTPDANPYQVEPVLPPAPPAPQPKKAHPLAGYGVHIAGYVGSNSKGSMYLFAISQNGQYVFPLNTQELKESGYLVEHQGECVAKVTYENQAFYAVCDAPRIGINPGGSFGQSASG